MTRRFPPGFATLFEFDAADPAADGEDPPDIAGQPHFTTSGDDRGHQRFGKARGAAHRVIGAGVVRAAHQRMLHERRLLRRRPVVGPTRPQHRPQRRVADLREFAGQRPAGPFNSLRAAPLPQPPCQQRRCAVQREQGERAAPRRFAVLKPGSDGSLLTGEPRHERLPEGAFGVLDAEVESRQMDDVVRVGARSEPQGVGAQPVQQPAELPLRSVLGSDAPDVVHAGRKGPVEPAEGLGQATGHGMLLQHQHFAPPTRQRRSRGQAADSRADDDRVPHAGLNAGSEAWSWLGSNAGLGIPGRKPILLQHPRLALDLRQVARRRPR